MDASPGMDATLDSTLDSSVRDAVMPPDGGPLGKFCSLPGSVVWRGGSPEVVPGGPPGPDGQAPPDLTWLKLPDGFCSHYYATVPETRQLKFSPSGDLFVASPSAACAGGASGGYGAVIVVPDDDHDGVADSVLHYKDGLPNTQAMLFANGHFYYQDNRSPGDGARIYRVPYTNGDRMVPSVTPELMLDVTIYNSTYHWPKAMDVDDTGNIYVTNGGDPGDPCDPNKPESQWPFHGGILRINGTPGGELIAKGTRNAIALRCGPGTGQCWSLELAVDFASGEGSREKLFPVHKGDDWGFPCCATANQPYGGVLPAPDCSAVTAENSSFLIDETPFGLDFEQGAWPGMWAKRVYVVLHGFVGSWSGARVVAIPTDSTGAPVPSSDYNDAAAPMLDFATGWDDGTRLHGRPDALTFAPDGRMFVAHDMSSNGGPLGGLILWIAPASDLTLDAGTDATSEGGGDAAMEGATDADAASSGDAG